MKQLLHSLAQGLCFVLAVFVSIQAHANTYDFVRDGIYYLVTSASKKTVEVAQIDPDIDILIPAWVDYMGNTYTVTSIGDEAFSLNRMGIVNIPYTVTHIAQNAFDDCYYLNYIGVEDDNPIYDSRNNCRAIIETATNTLIVGAASTVIPESVTSIGESAFEARFNLTSIDIPNSVTSIGDYAFASCNNLTSVTIGNGVTSIGDHAFEYCHDVTSLTIPNSVTSIGDYAFSGWTGLTSLTIGNSVSSIGDNAFYNCQSLTSLTIPNSVTSIGEYAFGCHFNLTSIEVETGNPKYDSRNNCNALIETATNTLLCGSNSTIIPEDVTSIAGGAFYNCSGLTSITIPNSVTSIGNSAFTGCSGLTSIEVEAGNITYDSRNNCNAIIETATNTLRFGCNSTIIPEDVTSIASAAFIRCSDLTSITIPNSVTSIGNSAFSDCGSLTSLTIGNSVTSIGSSAFRNCSRLTDVWFYAESVPSTKSDAFDNSSIGLATLHVPAASVESYHATSPWSSFGNIVAISNDNREEQTLSLAALPAMTYGDAAYTLPTTTAQGQTLTWTSSNTAVATVSGNVLTIKGAGTATITASQAGNDQYLPFSKQYTLNVAKAALTITADNKSKQQGEANPELTVTYNGFKYGDNASVLTTPPTVTTTATADSPAGTYPITVSGAAAANYNITYVSGTLTVTEGPVVIEVTDISQLNNAIYIEPFSARSGNTVSMDIRLKNNQDIAAYSFDLVLPEGVTLGKNAQNKFIYTLADDRHDEHSCTINEKSGNTYSVAVLSISGGEISGNDGTVVTLQAVMGENMEEGDYPIQIQNVMYSLPNGQTVNVPATQTALTIENVLVGDVNDNGTIDIGDAVCIVNHIVGKPNAVFVERAADVNGNGTAGEIGDAVSVVNIIVGKAMPQAARKARENRMNMLDPQ